MKKILKRVFSFVLSAVLCLTAASVGVFASAEGMEIDRIEAVAGRKLIADADLDYGSYYDYNSQQVVYCKKYQVHTTNPTITVYYKNGTSQTAAYWNANFTDDQTAENKWTVGEHKFYGEYDGFSFEYPVEVIENPIEKITVTKKLKVFEGVDGHLESSGMNEDDPKWFRYDPAFYSAMEIELKDGRKFTYGQLNMEVEFGRYYYPELSSGTQSYENQWTVGNTYKPTVEFMGKTAECEVEVAKNPVVKIEVPDTMLVKEKGGYFESYTDSDGVTKQWYRYSDNSLYSRITVFFEDNRAVPFNRIDMEKEFGSSRGFTPSWYSEQSYENRWVTGNTYKTSVTFMGRTAEYNISIVDNPIKGIKVTATKPLIENVSGYESYTEWQEKCFQYDIYQAELSVTVYMADGRTLDINEIEPYREFGEYAYLQINDDQYENHWSAGVHTVKAQYFGAECEFEVIVSKALENTEFAYIEQNGSIYITDYLGTSETVTVPAEIGGKKVVAVTDFNSADTANLNFVKKVIIPDGVKSISEIAFHRLTGLEYAEIGADIEQLDNLSFPQTLKGITVSENNKYYCSIDGVAYNKALTAVAVYPFSRGKKLTLPQTVSDISAISEIGADVDYEVSNDSKDFVTEDGVVYTKDKKTVIACDSKKSGKYIMPDSVTGVVYGAFANCTKLTEVQLSSSLTSAVYRMFENCTSLKSVTLPDGLIQIGGSAFSGCTSLSDIALPDTVEMIGDTAFSDSGLTGIKLPNRLESIGTRAFSDSKLKSVAVPESIMYIGPGAFASTPLISLTLPSSGMNIGDSAFAYTALEELTIPNGPIFGRYAFVQCRNLKKVTVGEGRTELGESIFEDCSVLETVLLPSTLTCVDTEAFNGCTALKNINLPESLAEVYNRAFKNCGKLTKLVFPKALKSIGISAFENCGLTSAVLPDDLEHLGEGAFNGCPLSEVEIKNIGKISGGAFSGGKITKIILPDTVTTIAYRAFADCSKLLDIEIPDSVISIDGDSFSNTAWSNTYSDGAMYLNKAFYGYKGALLPENSILTIKNGTKTIANRLAAEADESFRTGLERLTLPDGLLRIGESSFENCRVLKSVNIPESVTEIGNYAFAGCESLQKIYIPASVTEIGYQAFINCDMLTEITVSPDNPNYSSVNGVLYDKNGTRLICCPAGKTGKLTLPNTVMQISAGAFSRCKKLTEVVIPETATSIDYAAFGFDYTKCSKYGKITYDFCFSGNYAAFKAPEGSRAAAYIARLDRLPCKEHKMTDWTEYRTSTCTLAGEWVRNCTECDYYEAKTVAAKGHSYSGEYVIDKAPTCTEDGRLSQRCTDCGKLVPDSVITVKASGHKFGDWITVNIPDCHREGEKTHECGICGETETEILPAAHRRGLWYWLITPEKNGGIGYKGADCEDCHEKQFITVAATELDNVGDLNDDKEINIKDIINIKKRLAKTGEYLREADLNRDGKLNSEDMAILRKYLLSVLKEL